MTAPFGETLIPRPIACIVLPTFNEAENISQVLPQIFSQADKISSHELHVLVVDDDSPDRTADRVREAQTRFPHLHLITGKKQGLGEAYKRGISHALNVLHPGVIVQMDADLQHDPNVLPQMIQKTQEGYDVVIGSRLAPGGSIPGLPWHRQLISRMGTLLVRWFARIPPIHDCTSGYRAIKADLIPRCDLDHLSTRGYSFQSSLLCELLANRARVLEIPIVFRSRLHGRSKLAMRDEWEFVVNLFRLRFRRRDRTKHASAP